MTRLSRALPPLLALLLIISQSEPLFAQSRADRDDLTAEPDGMVADEVPQEQEEDERPSLRERNRARREAEQERDQERRQEEAAPRARPSPRRQAADPLRVPEARLAVAERLCANTWLRTRLAMQYARIGNRETGSDRIINCFRPDPLTRLRAFTPEVAAALDIACPNADVLGWLTDPALIPAQGCGPGYAEPDWGPVPSTP